MAVAGRDHEAKQGKYPIMVIMLNWLALAPAFVFAVRPHRATGAAASILSARRISPLDIH